MDASEKTGGDGRREVVSEETKGQRDEEIE
jgi:hypothetical protein